MGDQADALADPAVLRLENLDTDLRPPAACPRGDAARGGRGTTRTAIYRSSGPTPCAGPRPGTSVPWPGSSTIGGNRAHHRGRPQRILTTLLALLEPGDAVVTTDPIYVGLLNRIRIAGGAPVLVP
jgi:hypothetical protein